MYGYRYGGAVGPFLPRGRITRPESREIPWVYLGQYLGSLSLHKREGELWTEKTSARSGAGQSWLYTRLAGRYLVPSYNRLYVTHMVAGVVPSTRLDSALVTEWPEAIDLESDIFIPSKVETFKLALVRALKSRGLWAVIAEVDPTLVEIQQANPDASPEEVIQAYDNGRAWACK